MTATNCAKKVISEYQLNYPLNIEQFCQNLNIKIFEKDLDMDACLIIKNGKTFILLNKYNYSKRKFSIAHELGHYFLDNHNELMFSCFDIESGSKSNNMEQEREADEFASELLIPSNKIEKKLLEDISFEIIKQLQEEFQTSLKSTAIKAVKSYPDSAILVMLKNGKYCWHVWSATNELKLDLGFNFSTLSQKAIYHSLEVVKNEEIDGIAVERLDISYDESLILIKQIYE